MADSDLSQMIADIVAGKMSFFELIRSAPKGDYFAHVQVSRLSYLIMREPEALKALQAEIAQAMREAGVEVDGEAIEKGLARKDGKRRFSKLLTHRAETFSDSQSLLSGPDFDSCLG